MKVYIFENSYYIGEDKNVSDNALRNEDIELQEGYELKVVDGELSQEKSE